MKKYIFVSFLFIYCLRCFSQNLVPNPSFEDTISCPNGLGFIDRALGWSSYSESPDYFNSCASSCAYPLVCYGIPDNFFGSQQAYNGNAYVGLGTFAEYPIRELIGIQLTQPLIPHKKYYVSCYISRAGAYPLYLYNGSGASNNFGFRFLMHPYSELNPCPIDNFSHVHDTTLVVDSINWTRISGSFIADTSYEYLALGNFYDDQHTTSVDVYDIDTLHSNFAYYFVDNVCVSEDSLCQSKTGTSELSQNSIVKIYSNPFTNELKISLNSNEEFEITLYDFSMRKLLRDKSISIISINTSHLGEGVYIYEIKIKNEIIKIGKIIKQ